MWTLDGDWVIPTYDCDIQIGKREVFWLINNSGWTEKALNLCVIRILVHGTKNSHVNSQYGEQKKNEER
jgi:hypothetical protein